MLAGALDIFFPPQCLVCNALQPTHGTLCTACWQEIRFISDPQCHCCGLPFDYEMGEAALCGQCMQEAPSYATARAVFRYDEKSRALVTRLKYADETHLANIYGPWLIKVGSTLIAASDIIIPVPLHYWRFVHRRYNQSALLAQALAKHARLPVLVDGLKRIRATPPQAGLTRKQRQDNVSGAFAVLPKHETAIKGKNILLVDDVMTTGATLEQCAKILRKAGARAVNILTLARVAD